MKKERLLELAGIQIKESAVNDSLVDQVTKAIMDNLPDPSEWADIDELHAAIDAEIEELADHIRERAIYFLHHDK